MIVEELLNYLSSGVKIKVVENKSYKNMLYKGKSGELTDLIKIDKQLKENKWGGINNNCFLKREVIEILPCKSEQMLMILIK